MGGGDCKLFTAAALFAGMEHLLALALATALTGAAIVLGRAALNPTRALVMLGMKGKGDFSVPYGVAIAVGTLAVVWGGLFNRIPRRVLNPQRLEDDPRRHWSSTGAPRCAKHSGARTPFARERPAMKLPRVPDLASNRMLIATTLLISVVLTVIFTTQARGLHDNLGDTDDAMRLVLVRTSCPDAAGTTSWSCACSRPSAFVCTGLGWSMRACWDDLAVPALRIPGHGRVPYPSPVAGAVDHSSDRRRARHRAAGWRIDVDLRHDGDLLRRLTSRSSSSSRPGRIDHHNVQIVMVADRCACAMDEIRPSTVGDRRRRGPAWGSPSASKPCPSRR